VLDRFDRPAFWPVLLGDLEAFLEADSQVAALLTKTAPGSSTTYVDIALGLTPVIPAPCIRIMRGDEGKQPLTAFRGDEIPQQIVFRLALCTQSSTPAQRDSQLSATEAWDALGALEAATLSALRRYFAPTRSLSSILGAPFDAEIQSIAPTNESYWPVVGSAISIILNKAA
jgi:hypothetical protein